METTKLPFRFLVAEGYATLVLTPYLSEVDWGEVEQVGAEIIRQVQQVSAPLPVLVDLTPLTYMGSSQVALVVRVWKAIQERHGRMAVQVTHPVVQEVLQIAGLNNLWTIVDTREEALYALGLSPAPRNRPAVAAVLIGLGGVIFAIVGLIVSAYAPDLIPRHILQIARGCADGVGAAGGLWAVIVGRHRSRTAGLVLLGLSLGLALLQFAPA